MADSKLSALAELLSLSDTDLMYVATGGTSRRIQVSTLKGLFLVETDIAAKGDLFVGLANDSAGVLAVGSNDQVLTADSTTGTGVKWATPATWQPLDADLTALAAAGNSAILAATTAAFLVADETKLDGIEAGADVTDAANVNAAGALMESEVDIDIKTLVLPANTTISAFGATLVDDADAAAARTTLGITPGIPAGGTATQVLTKNSGTDYDASWAPAPGGGSGLTEAQVRTRAFVGC